MSNPNSRLLALLSDIRHAKNWSTEDEEKARVFMTGKFFHACIIFAGEARAYPSVEKCRTAFGLTCNY
jgi:hypothetical protein